MIKPTKPPSPRLLALRRAAEEAKARDEELALSQQAQARIDEQEAILLKPQPKSNGRVNGIEW